MDNQKDEKASGSTSIKNGQLDLTPTPSEMNELVEANPIQPSYLRRSNFWEDFKSVTPTQVANAYTLPCARSSLLYGLSGGFIVGLARFVFEARFRPGGAGSVLKACNWAVGSFCFVSIISWEKCMHERRLAEFRVTIAAQQFKRIAKQVEEKRALYTALQAEAESKDSSNSTSNESD